MERTTQRGVLLNLVILTLLVLVGFVTGGFTGIVTGQLATVFLFSQLLYSCTPSFCG